MPQIEDFRGIAFQYDKISLFRTILIRQRGIAFFILFYCAFNSRKTQ
jgi:hypothetical protein